MMSTKMRSGWWSAILASASKPLSARITWHPACMRKISALRRIVLLSSITITRTPARLLGSATLSLVSWRSSPEMGAAFFSSRQDQVITIVFAKQPPRCHFSPRFGTLPRNRPRGIRNSHLDHFEIVLARPAFGAAPSRGNVFPARPGDDAILRPAFGLVVDEAAGEAAPHSVG